MTTPTTTTTAAAAAPMPPPKELTLIVATTLSRGIGRGGGLPWPRLKGEMGYFARVTKRVPSSAAAGSGSSDGAARGPDGQEAGATKEKRNAVIMGRKTWESIPARLRPLGARWNVVVSSSLSSSEAVQQQQQKEQQSSAPDAVARTFDEAVQLASAAASVERVFIIGGAAVYKDALGHATARRVLLTRIKAPEYECDTFFPVDLEGERGWRRGSVEEWREWTGESGDVEREEDGVRYEFCLYEREQGSLARGEVEEK